MARLARWVVPGYPHHVTQRGVRSMDIFADGVTFLGWCLMSHHVHLIAIPERTDSLARGIGEAHQR